MIRNKVGKCWRTPPPPRTHTHSLTVAGRGKRAHDRVGIGVGAIKGALGHRRDQNRVGLQEGWEDKWVRKVQQSRTKIQTTSIATTHLHKIIKTNHGSYQARLEVLELVGKAGRLEAVVELDVDLRVGRQRRHQLASTAPTARQLGARVAPERIGTRGKRGFGEGVME